MRVYPKLIRKIAEIKNVIYKEMLLDYRIMEGKGFLTVDRKIARLFCGIPYSVGWYPVTELHRVGTIAYNRQRTWPNNIAAKNYITHELAQIDAVLGKIKEAKK